MDQFAKGINLMVPHAVWYDPTRSSFRRSCRYRTEPYGPSCRPTTDYIGRLQRVLQQRPARGRHRACSIPIATLAGRLPLRRRASPTRAASSRRRPTTWTSASGCRSNCAATSPSCTPRRSDARCHGRTTALLRLQQPGVSAAVPRVHPARMERSPRRNLAQDQGRSTISGGQVIATTRLPDQSAEFGQDAEVRAMVRAHLRSQADARRTVGASRPVFANATPAAARACSIATVRGRAASRPIDAPSGARRGLGGATPGCRRELVTISTRRSTVARCGSSPTRRTRRSTPPVDLRGTYSLERWDPHTGRIEP